MLQLLLVTHINREQMATTRAAAAAAEGGRERDGDGEGGRVRGRRRDGVERSLMEIDVFANTRRGEAPLSIQRVTNAPERRLFGI